MGEGNPFLWRPSGTPLAPLCPKNDKGGSLHLIFGILTPRPRPGLIGLTYETVLDTPILPAHIGPKTPSQRFS